MSCTSPNTVASTTLPFVDAFRALEELLEMRDGLLHHFGRLQDERQDQLAARRTGRRRLSSPASRILLSTSTGARSCSASSIFASMPSLRRRRIALWMRSSTGVADSSSFARGRGAPSLESHCLEVLDQPRQARRGGG